MALAQYQYPVDLTRFTGAPTDRTVPPGSATATAIVSACTSRPTNCTFLMTGSFRMWLCVVQCSNSQRNPRAANWSRSFHCD